MRNLYCFSLFAITLIACSATNIPGASGTTQPTPAPVLQHCTAQVADSDGHHATLAINFSPAPASASASAAAAPAGAILTLTPSSVTLTPQSPSAHVVVSDPGYSGHYSVEFIDCNARLDVRFLDRNTLEISN